MHLQKFDESSNEKRSERGAALITTILLATLLLAAGGTLILTSAMTGTNAVDSTAELQAYYAAEAGVAQTINVLRGNVPSNPAGTTATFRNLVSTPSLWTPISGATVNVTANGSSSFRVTSVSDPDDQNGSIRNNDPLYKPSRLRIQIAGFGPRHSRKNMEVIVNRYTANYAVTATITIPNTSGTPINFALGSSNPTSYSGLDTSGNPQAGIAAFAISGADATSTQNVINGCRADGTFCSGSAPNVTPSTPQVLDSSNTPNFLATVDSARTFLYGTDGMMAIAQSQGRYFTNGTAAINSPAGVGANNPAGVLTFVDGDFVLGPGNPTGQGTLIVTGTLTLDGNFQWNGVIMVLGGGTVLRSGGGHGDIFGAMFIAKFARTGASTDVFQAPTFDTTGGGSANIQYNSAYVDMAKSTGGHAVAGIRECFCQ